MKIFFDTEFEESPVFGVRLISIGMIREDGQTYYAENRAYDWNKADPWLIENVKPHLTGPLKFRDEIRKEILEFVGEKPEFWAYFADYDWVVLCQLFGRMINLPKGWPMFCLDLKQEMYLKGYKREWFPNQIGTEHNALEDAKWNKMIYQLIMEG